MSRGAITPATAPQLGWRILQGSVEIRGRGTLAFDYPTVAFAVVSGQSPHVYVFDSSTGIAEDRPCTNDGRAFMRAIDWARQNARGVATLNGQTRWLCSSKTSASPCAYSSATTRPRRPPLVASAAGAWPHPGTPHRGGSGGRTREPPSSRGAAGNSGWGGISSSSHIVTSWSRAHRRNFGSPSVAVLSWLTSASIACIISTLVMVGYCVGELVVVKLVQELSVA